LTEGDRPLMLPEEDRIQNNIFNSKRLGALIRCEELSHARSNKEKIKRGIKVIIQHHRIEVV
jgi:hypothetical protein